MSVGAPSDAVELNVGLANLVRGRDGEEIKALDLILTGADAAELPVPDDLGAAGHEDLVGGNVRIRRRMKDAINEFSLAGGSNSAKLQPRYQSSLFAEYGNGGNVCLTGAPSSERMESEISV